MQEEVQEVAELMLDVLHMLHIVVVGDFARKPGIMETVRLLVTCQF